MGLSKEYYLKLQEEEFDRLNIDAQCYLNALGLQVRQKETEIDKEDNHYKELKKARIKAFNDEQEYLFKKRNKMHGT
ncbi:MAG: hypothetical protein RSD53_03150 [Algoriella sp.]